MPLKRQLSVNMSRGEAGDGFTGLAMDPSRSMPAAVVYDEAPLEEVNGYVIGNILGEGSYGRVCEALCKATQRRVAIKVLNKHQLRKYGGAQVAVQKEVAMLGQLHHKGVLELIECFEDEEEMYIVLQYVDGGTLQDLIDAHEETHLSERVCRFYMLQLLGALKAVHAARIIHGDIKPENLLLDTQGLLLLSDFGVSERIGDDGLCESGVVTTGSPAFQPPECVSTEQTPSTAKVDLWAAGVTLIMMLTGEPPFDGASMVDLFATIQRGEYTVRDEWSEPLRDFLARLLSVDVSERASVDEALGHAWLMKGEVASVQEVVALLPPPEASALVDLYTPKRKCAIV